MIGLTLDCADAQLMRAFWKSALGYVDEPPPAPFTSREEWHMDVPVAVHGSADERCAQVLAEAERLVALGGAALAAFGRHHVVIADPEGNEFCLAPAPA